MSFVMPTFFLLEKEASERILLAYFPDEKQPLSTLLRLSLETIPAESVVVLSFCKPDRLLISELPPARSGLTYALRGASS